MTHGARTGNVAREMCVAASQSIALTPGRAPARAAAVPRSFLRSPPTWSITPWAV